MLTPVLLALAGACAFALSTVVQHRTAADAAASGGGRWLARLIHRPAWLAAQAAGAVGVVLHAAALKSGPVALVQPLLASGLLISLLTGAWIDRRRPGRQLPGRRQWLAGVTVAAGLTTFLLAARPADGSAVAQPGGLALATAAALVVGGLAAWWTRRPGRPHRAPVRGAAAGGGFAVAGLLLKQLTGVPVLSWSAADTCLELVAVGAVGICLSQAAFAGGPLVDSLPVTTVLEPAVGVVLAVPLFGEVLVSGAGARLGQLAGALLLVGGLVVLARHGSAAAPDPVPEPFRRRSGELRTVDA